MFKNVKFQISKESNRWQLLVAQCIASKTFFVQIDPTVKSCSKSIRERLISICFVVIVIVVVVMFMTKFNPLLSSLVRFCIHLLNTPDATGELRKTIFFEVQFVSSS